MKKIKKSSCPDGLAEFAAEQPQAGWSEFRDAEVGLSYKETRQRALTDQGQLCAYCETSYNDDACEFSIEHFQPKSTQNPDGKNWALDWSNMLAVCRGGRDAYAVDKNLYPTPANLSCDAYRDHADNTPECLNPLQIPAGPLFSFNRATNELEPHADLKEPLTQQVQDSIDALNLNCPRLCDARYQVFISYNQLMAKARRANNREIKQQLATHWFSNVWPSFFSTRRSLLGIEAEKYLSAISFDG